MTGSRFASPLVVLATIPALAAVTHRVPSANAATGIVINEIVVDPQQDWDDSGAGTPFDEVPGAGSVTVADEWVEIVNASGSFVDLTGWTLEMVDTSPLTLSLSAPGATVLAFSPGSTLAAFAPGGRLVVGDVPGDMANDVYLALRDASSLVVDDVEIGDDAEGDGAGDGAPEPGLDGNASSLADEAIARVPNAIDADADVADFDKQAATIGAANSAPPPIRINEVVVDPQQDWDDSGGTPFDASPGGGAVDSGDEWIELYNASLHAVNVAGWKVHYVDSSPEVLELGTPGASTVLCSPGSSTTALLPGGYVVLGDAPGSMNNSVHVILQDAFGEVADDVEIGDDPEGDGPGDGAPASGEDGDATGLADQAVARAPNGEDTDDDVADFAKAEATIGTANPTPVFVAPIPPSFDVLGLEVRPHPVRGSTELTLRLPERCGLELTVHDVAGREVSRLPLAPRGPGLEPFAWTAPPRSGVYWIRLRGRGLDSGRPLELVRQVTVVR